MVDENYSNFTTTRPNKGVYQPDEPESHRKERIQGKGAIKREEKRLATVFSFYSVDFRRQKNKAKDTQECFLGRPGFHQSR